MLGETPSCAWISRALQDGKRCSEYSSRFAEGFHRRRVTYRFGYRRAPKS